MSLTYVAVIVSVLSAILPRFGITIGSDELTTTVSTLVTVIGGLVALYGRYRAGGINFAGFRKQ